MELVAEAALWIIMSGIHAIVGILYPVNSVWLRRIQRVALALLTLGILAVIGGFVALICRTSFAVSLSALAAGFMVLVISGCLGAHIERCHLEEKGNSP